MARHTRYIVAIGELGARITGPGMNLIDVPAVAVRRSFSDASNVNRNASVRPEAWVVGADAKALQSEFNKSKDSVENDLAVLDFLDTIQATDKNIFDRLRFMIGLLATSRDLISSELETKINIETTFVLTHPSEYKNYEDLLLSPPFWLIYGLRRFKWPGRFSVSFVLDPFKSAKHADSLKANSFSIDPVLQHTPGTLIAEDNSTNVSPPLTIEIHVDGSAPIILGTKSAALPVYGYVPFFDQPLDLTQHNKIRFLLQRNSNQTKQHILTVTRHPSPPEGREVGWVPSSVAPHRAGPPYMLHVVIDVWGRLRLSITDPLGAPLPITFPTLESGAAHATSRESNVLHVESLLFPQESDARLLETVPIRGGNQPDEGYVPDPIETLDSTSFNGQPALPQELSGHQRERYHLRREDFWMDEQCYVRDDVEDRDVQLFELALCALRTQHNPESTLTSIHGYDLGSSEDINAWVKNHEFVDFERLSQPLTNGEKIRTFMRSLRDYMPDELGQLKAEVSEYLRYQDSEDMIESNGEEPL